MPHSIARGLARFVRFNSVCTRSNTEFTGFVGRLLAKRGFRVSYQKTTIGGKRFVNVIGWKGRAGRPLLMCAHLDTVPPGELSAWTKTRRNPWEAAVEGNRLYGLGSADDKGSLLAMIEAASRFPAGILKRPLVILGTFGEENGMGGAKLFLRTWKKPKPIAALVGEPTSLAMTYRHKGLGVLVIEIESRESVRIPQGAELTTVTFQGKQAHSSRPHLGDNALEKAMEFVKREVKKNQNLKILSIEGGVAANLVPARASVVFVKLSKSCSAGFPPNKSADQPQAENLRYGLREEGVGKGSAPAILVCYEAVRALVKRMSRKSDRSFLPPTLTSNFGAAEINGKVTTLVFDFRLLPGQSIGAIYSELRKTLRRKLAAYPRLKWRISIERDNPPLGMGLRDPFLQAGKHLLQKHELPVVLETKPSCTEAGMYERWGVPAFVFGPGESGANVHAPNESIEISEIEKAIEVYAGAIEEVCVKDSFPPPLIKHGGGESSVCF